MPTDVGLYLRSVTTTRDSQTQLRTRKPGHFASHFGMSDCRSGLAVLAAARLDANARGPVRPTVRADRAHLDDEMTEP